MAKAAETLDRRMKRKYPGICKTIDPRTGKINDKLILDKLIKKFDNDRKDIKRELKLPRRE